MVWEAESLFEKRLIPHQMVTHLLALLVLASLHQEAAVVRVAISDRHSH